MSTEPKAKKDILPKEVRVMMVNFLESQNIEDADAMDDEKILMTYNDETLKLNEKSKRHELTQETKGLNMYLNANIRMRLTNKEFIARLFKMSVPAIYLHLFKEDDMELNDRDLWRIINKSGIDPVDNVTMISKMKRSPLKPKVFNQLA